MADLLSKDQYAAIAADLQLRTKAFIDGEFRDAISGRTFVTTNPATGKQLAEVAACDVNDVDVAVAAAKRVFEAGTWSKMQPNDRKHVLQKFAQLLEDNAHELAVLEALDSGKPVSECQTVDVPETIHTIRWHAELIDKIYDATAPTGNAAVTMVVREAIGVVGLVLPWNFPLLMLAWKIAPSLAAGCSIVVKPAKETTLSALRVAELAHEAGIPAGVFNLVPGGGREVGEAIGRHMDIPMVSFTGSTDTGRLFLKYAAESNLKRIVLELGGKNPAVVMNDAKTWTKWPSSSPPVRSGTWARTARPLAPDRAQGRQGRAAEPDRQAPEGLEAGRSAGPGQPPGRDGQQGALREGQVVPGIRRRAETQRRPGGETEGVFVQPTIVDNVAVTTNCSSRRSSARC
jgi:gamma-glutamyl-gamma-aminobutyraldehyde dehydrogenase